MKPLPKGFKKLVTLDDVHKHWILTKKFAYHKKDGSIYVDIYDSPSEPWWNEITTFGQYCDYLKRENICAI